MPRQRSIRAHARRRIVQRPYPLAEIPGPLQEFYVAGEAEVPFEGASEFPETSSITR